MSSTGPRKDPSRGNSDDDQEQPQRSEAETSSNGSMENLGRLFERLQPWIIGGAAVFLGLVNTVHWLSQPFMAHKEVSTATGGDSRRNQANEVGYERY